MALTEFRFSRLKTQEAMNKLQALADEGCSQYASGDGLQAHSLMFPDEFAVDAWVLANFHGYDDEEILDPGFTCY
mgnify:CR=1 FL=1